MTMLKINTEYSLLESLIKIEDLITFLNSHNIKTCGICDKELFGVMPFYLECQKNGIKPVVGYDLKIDNISYFIYARNYEGYKSLLKINTLRYQNKLNIDVLNDNNLLIIIPYEYIDSVNLKDNFYIGYKNRREKESALLITNNIVYVNNIRVLYKNDIKHLNTLKLLNENLEYTEDDYYHLSIEEDDKRYIQKFTDLIDLTIPFDKKYIPKIKENSFNYLKSLANIGLEKRLNNKIDEKYQKRLDEELKVINDMGFTDYFLIVYDYVLYAKKNNILVGPGRGSAAGSLVSYAIGITEIDPIKYDLLFSRFLNPARAKMPDIDIDFEDDKRMDVINYVKNKYGINNVALGLTFNTYKSRLLLRDLAKVMFIEEKLFNKFIREIEASKSLKDNLKKESVKKYLELYPKLNTLYNEAFYLENLKKNVSTHAAGVVICSQNLDTIIPIISEGDIYKTGYAMEYLEMQGLLKMDFLGLRNLSFIKDVIKLIPNFNIDDINYEDKKVYELFQNGNTEDIFQFESIYAQNILKKLKIENFDELVIATALVRPGPSHEIEMYISNKNKVVSMPDKLWNILKSTRGVIIFQEQVMQIFTNIAGYKEYEADLIRYAMSKKKQDVIEKEEQEFIKRAVSNGYEDNFARSLFDKMCKFSEYGFNKSHAVSYSKIIYTIAYLKVNYFKEFNIVLLKNCKDKNKYSDYLNELKKNGINILKPNINVSGFEIKLKNNNLLLPFSIIDGLTENIIKQLIQRRGDGYKDIYDFFIKAHDLLNEKIFEILVYSGCLDIFKINKQSLINSYNILKNYAQLNDLDAAKPLLISKEEYDNSVLSIKEKEIYSFYVGNHPSSLYKTIKINKLEQYLFKNIDIVVVVENIKRIKTKKGEDMAFIKVSDETSSTELTVFPKQIEMLNELEKNDLIFVNVKPSRRFDKYSIIVNNIKRKNVT